MKYLSVGEFVKWNEAQPCTAPGCHRNRDRKGKFCDHHYMHRYITGELSGVPLSVSRGLYADETKKVRVLIEKNLATHEGVIVALSYITKRMVEGSAGRITDAPLARLWAGLHTYNANPVDVLVRSAAPYVCWLQKRLFTVDNHVWYNVGRDVMCLAKQKELGICAYRLPFLKMGRELDEHLRPLFLLIAKTITDADEEENQNKMKLSKPFALK